MSPGKPFTLLYAPLFKETLKSINPKYFSLIRKTIEEQLIYEADIENRNRKPLKRPIDFEASWEIRFGPKNRFRIFYDIVRESNQVLILAIGEKQGDRLFIGGKEIEL